jgi:hypothetical protein
MSIFSAAVISSSSDSLVVDPTDDESSPVARPGLPPADDRERDAARADETALLDRAELALDLRECFDLVGDTLPFARTCAWRDSVSLCVCALASSLESLSACVRDKLRSRTAFCFWVWYDARAMDLYAVTLRFGPPGLASFPGSSASFTVLFEPPMPDVGLYE